MPRMCKNLLTSYLKLVEGKSEPPRNYHIWCCMSTIATCLQRKVWLDWGTFYIYPNMYIVLIGPPATKKSTAIRMALRLIINNKDVKLGADATTREALIKELKLVESTITMPDGKPYTHASLTLISKELSVLLKGGKDNQDLLSLLTDLFDCDSKWIYKTKGAMATGTVDEITNVWLNILAGSTPDWLVQSLPAAAVEGGFTSRVVFIVEDKPAMLIPRPQCMITSADKELRKHIMGDFDLVSKLKGEMRLTDDAGEFFDKWYITHKSTPEQYDKKFRGYMNRKTEHLLKIAMIISIACGDDLIVNLDHVKTALSLLDGIQDRMFGAFGSVGRAKIAPDIADLLSSIKAAGKEGITKVELQKGSWRDVGPQEFEVALATMINMRIVKDVFDLARHTVVYTFKEETKC